ncbi:TPA: phage tail protein, partial [Escherichia coli]|nr:phage tail protein [Escherichia coli]
GASAQSRKILVMGHAVSSGSADALSLTRITSDSQADQLYGKGSMLAEMLKMLRRANTYTETWAMPVAAPEGAAAKATLTVLGTATDAGTVALLINGVSVQVSVSAGDTKENIAKAIADAVTKKPATQVAAAVKDDATDTVELTVNWHGVTGNGADVRLNYYTGEAFPAGVKVTATAFTGGTGTPEMTDAVAAIGPEWFTDIIAPFTDTKSLNTLRDELLNRWGPLKMMEAQLWTAFRGTHGETGTFGETRNDWLISCIGTNLSPHPAWMWAASYGATAAYHLAIDPARPLQTLVLTGILPPARNVRWDMPERNLLLHDGIATHMVDAGDNVC